ncbi:MAG: TIGR03087 family PEP-CTERM/XrtA system glycosyltransferase, partial [Sphingomonas sp.]
LHAAVRKVLAIEAIDTIYVFSSQMAQYLPPTPRQRVIMDFVDMDSAKFAAYAEASRGPLRWLMKREARLLLAFERKIAAQADVSLFVSQAEADLFRDATGIANVRAIENGIDTDFFDPSQMFEPIVSNGRLIVFTGQMDYRPNVEAVTRFAQHVLPIVRREHRDVQFAIVGRSPSAEVIALAGLEGVTVTGEVADVRGWLAAASVVVAPLLLARGVQNKVLEAMAMARPVVASRAAAEGIDHADTIRVGTTAAELAAEVIAVLDDPREAAVLGHAARLQVQQRYGWDARLAPLDALLRVSPAVLPRTAAA